MKIRMTKCFWFSQLVWFLFHVFLSSLSLKKAAYLLNPSLPTPQYCSRSLFHKPSLSRSQGLSLGQSYGFIIVTLFLDLSVAPEAYFPFSILEDSVLMTWLPCPIFLLFAFFCPSLSWWFLFYFKSFHTHIVRLLKLKPTASKHSIKYT